MSTYNLDVSNGTSRSILLRVAGEVDMAAAPGVMDAILGAALSNPTYQVVVDLDHVTFIDSVGLGALIEAHQRLAEQNMRLVISSPSDAVRRLMTVTGTADYLGVAADQPGSIPA